DPAPPAGLSAGIGISVQGLFLPPGQSSWSQAIVQPGFFFQDYQRQQVNGAEWLYPQGSPVWKIRFAPEAQGAWQYQVQAQDASICSPGVNPCTSWVSSAIGSFTATAPAPNDHGFVQVSKNDSRYFELADGKNFVGLGYDSGFGTTDFTYNVDQQYAQWAANGVDFFRVWMSGSTIAGSAWGPWAWFGAPDYGGYLPDPGLWIAPAGSGHDFAFYFDQASGRTCYINCSTQGNVAVKPSTTYQLSVTAQVANVTGPRNPATPGFGFTVKKGAWPSTCPDGIESYTPLVPLMNGTVGTWTTETTTITTGSSQWFLDDLFMVLDNVSGGQAYVSQISLKEVLPGGALGPELLVKSTGDQHMDYNLLRSWDWDYALDQAAIKGIFLKLVVLEKNDRIWNFINWDGTLSSNGGNDNFYAAPNTKVRALHQCFWRYLAARWSYATGLHSWELLNE